MSSQHGFHTCRRATRRCFAAAARPVNTRWIFFCGQQGAGDPPPIVLRGERQTTQRQPYHERVMVQAALFGRDVTVLDLVDRHAAPDSVQLHRPVLPPLVRPLHQVVAQHPLCRCPPCLGPHNVRGDDRVDCVLGDAVPRLGVQPRKEAPCGEHDFRRCGGLPGHLCGVHDRAASTRLELGHAALRDAVDRSVEALGDGKLLRFKEQGLTRGRNCAPPSPRTHAP